MKGKQVKFCVANVRNLNKKEAATEDTLVSRQIDFGSISEAGIVVLPPTMREFTYFRAEKKEGVVRKTIN